MEKEKVSVVVPIYNAEEYLSECIESILTQSYRNIEIILIDDGSVDGSREICNKYSLLDDRIIVVNSGHRGVSECRNNGIELSSGKYIMFVDADDSLSDTIIEVLYENSNDNDIICCCCLAISNHQTYEDHFFPEDCVFQDDKESLFIQLLDSQYMQPQFAYTAIGVPWGKLYKRSFIEKYKLRFNPELIRAQDNIFNTYAFRYANTIQYIDRCLYLYKYDHFKNYAYHYSKEKVNNLIKIQVERNNAYTQLGLLENEKVRNAFYTSSANTLISICSKYIFANGDDYKTRKRRIDEILECKAFCDCINQNLKFDNLLKAIYFIMIKRKKYCGLQFASVFSGLIRNRK